MVPNLQVTKSQHMDVAFEALYLQKLMQLIFPHLGWQAYTAVLRFIPKALTKLQLSMPPAASQQHLPCETRSRRLMSAFRTTDNTSPWYVISIAVCTVDWSNCHKHQNALAM